MDTNSLKRVLNQIQEEKEVIDQAYKSIENGIDLSRFVSFLEDNLKILEKQKLKLLNQK